jgi:hypothetical protein
MHNSKIFAGRVGQFLAWLGWLQPGETFLLRWWEDITMTEPWWEGPTLGLPTNTGAAR